MLHCARGLYRLERLTVVAEPDVFACGNSAQTSGCTHANDVIVQCSAFSTLRLVGGTTASTGRLELYHNGSKGVIVVLLERRAVCALGFVRRLGPAVLHGFRWDRGECRVSAVGLRRWLPASRSCCAALLYSRCSPGLRPVQRLWCARERGCPCVAVCPHPCPPPSLPLAEPTLASCSHGDWFNNQCLISFYQVGLTCTSPVNVRIQGGPTQSAGRVEVLHNGVWGSVCRCIGSFSSGDSPCCFTLPFMQLFDVRH